MELTIDNLRTASLENLRLAALLMNNENTAEDMKDADRYDLWPYLEYAADQNDNEEPVKSYKQWVDSADAPDDRDDGYYHRGDGVPAL